MKSFYYNIDDAEFIDPAGEKIPRCVPELFYQEMAEWRIFLRDRENRPRDISSIVGWSAAVDCDYSGDSAPMCRTPSENITPDETAGAVTVRIDAATAEFLAAVNGSRQRRAFFELYGVNATGEREIHLGFDISARMILDPSPGTPQEVPETFATKLYVDLTVGNASAAVTETLGRELAERTTGDEARAIASAVVGSGGYVDSAGARAIASGAAQTAVSGAIFSNAEVDTQIGAYRITATSGGGLVVSGSGASVVLSGGQIAANGGTGEMLIMSGGTVCIQAPETSAGERPAIMLDSNGNVDIYNGFGPRITMNDDYETRINDRVDVRGPLCAGGLYVDSRPVATQLVTLTDYNLDDPMQPTAALGVIAGGVNYVYTQPRYLVSATGVAKTTEASYIHFTLDSVTAPTPVVIPGVSCLNSATFEGGKEYLLRFFDGMMETHEVMPDPEKPVDSSTGAWYKSGADVLSSGMTLANVAVSGGETLNLYDRGVATGATVYSGGTMNISSGGVGLNISTTQAGGAINVYAGGVISGVSTLGGPVYVSSGARVEGAYLSAGPLSIRTGAVVSGAILFSGENLRVSGYAENTVISSGVFYISSGGTANGVTLSNGVLVVYSGASALAVTSLGGTVTVAEGGYIEYVTE